MRTQQPSGITVWPEALPLLLGGRKEGRGVSTQWPSGIWTRRRPGG